jgi:capsular exopolysaccharide synthesis family protein
MHTAVTNLPKALDQGEWHLDAMDEHLVSLVDPTSFEADQYRTLRHVVEGMHVKKKVIAVTSAVPGEGKTTTCINLAGSLAHATDANILMIDLDMRTPSVANRLGLTAQSPNLVDLLLDPDHTLNDAVRQHPRFRLSVVPGGVALMVPYELLKSPRLRDLLHKASQQYDYIVLDTPPLVPVPDSRLISDCVDGFLMVLAAHQTPRTLLEDSLSLMDPAKVLGIVFNKYDRPFSRYYGYYGYGAYHARHRRARHRAINGQTSLLDRALRGFLGWLGHPRE